MPNLLLAGARSSALASLSLCGAASWTAKPPPVGGRRRVGVVGFRLGLGNRRRASACFRCFGLTGTGPGAAASAGRGRVGLAGLRGSALFGGASFGRQRDGGARASPSVAGSGCFSGRRGRLRGRGAAAYAAELRRLVAGGISVPSGRTEIVLTRLGSAPTGDTGVALGRRRRARSACRSRARPATTSATAARRGLGDGAGLRPGGQSTGASAGSPAWAASVSAARCRASAANRFRWRCGSSPRSAARPWSAPPTPESAAARPSGRCAADLEHDDRADMTTARRRPARRLSSPSCASARGGSGARRSARAVSPIRRTPRRRRSKARES